jgi:hypothetical protein
MKRFHYMKAYIDDDFTDGTIRLISYNSGILDILGDTLTFYKHWNYSISTKRQLTRFLSDKFYRKVYRKEYRSTQIGFSTIRFTDAMDRLLGLIIFHNNGNTYLIK